MARRSLPLRRGSAGREAVRAGARGVLDVLHPLIVLLRGAGRLVALLRQWWLRTPKRRRDPLLFLAAAVLLTLSVLPYGPALALATVLGTAGWLGRDEAAEPGGREPGEDGTALQAVYEALVPCFATPGDPDPESLYTLGARWEPALEESAFGDGGRIEQLRLRYPASFRDGDAGERLLVERVLTAHCGRDREYVFRWEEERNRLTLTALDPLPDDVPAQRFVTGPGETVLGFTDPCPAAASVPVMCADGETRDAAPVIWRTGTPSADSHLLAVGAPGAGTSTLLRSLVLQALRHGDVIVIDGGGTGEHACLAGRSGVLAVETTPVGAVAVLEWAARETERRLLAAGRAHRTGQPAPPGTRRPLWVVLDRPSTLSRLADVSGGRDPQELLQVPLRHGRAARVTVVVGEEPDGAARSVRDCARTRVVLGALSPEEARETLGAPPASSPTPHCPPGRGYARLPGGPVLRLQVPATPHPYDEGADDAVRQAVVGLLPARTDSAERAGQAT